MFAFAILLQQFAVFRFCNIHLYINYKTRPPDRIIDASECIKIKVLENIFNEYSLTQPLAAILNQNIFKGIILSPINVGYNQIKC